jgi:hypothetical protein
MTYIPLLLADPSPCLRSRVLAELLHAPPDNPELAELAALRPTDRLAAELIAGQEADGSWRGSSLAGSLAASRLQATAQALARLGTLGFGPGTPAVDAGAACLFALQEPDGAWPLEREVDSQEGKGYSMVPLQTTLPLRALALCGYAEDPRCEQAYAWLLAQALPDGAWPTGISFGNYGGVAGYRRLAHSRWGCRSNTTGALCCLALHPMRRSSPPARRALDLLLGRETREASLLGFEIARLLGAEPSRGLLTYFARFDLALLLDLCWRVGADLSDERVADLASFVGGLQGPYGLWEYPPRPQVSRWLTFDLLRSLSHLDEGGDWLSLEPRTPFKAYMDPPRRF